MNIVSNGSNDDLTEGDAITDDNLILPDEFVRKTAARHSEVDSLYLC